MNTIQNDLNGAYVFYKFNDEYWRVNKIVKGKATPEYIFKNISHEFHEYKLMCQYHQQNPESHFTQKRLITIPTEKGRTTISGDKLTIKEGNKIVTEKYLKNRIELTNALWNFFNVKL